MRQSRPTLRASRAAKRKIRIRSICSAIGATLILSSCGGSSTDSHAASHIATFDLRDDPAKAIPPVDPTRSDVAPSAVLHQLLDALLSEHSALAVHLMRAVVDGGPADRDAVTKSLAANTKSLTGAIGLVYGPDGARAFDQLWKQHIQFFANYAAAKSKSARAKALADLHDYQTDFSSFTATATDGLAPLEAVLGLLHTHVAQFTAQSDAYREHDYVAAVRHQHEAREHMYEIAAALAGAISTQQPQAFPASQPYDAALTAKHARTEAVQLRLDRAWSSQYRPKMVPAFEAEIARLEADDASDSGVLALSDARSPDELVSQCVQNIARHLVDDAMACSHEALVEAQK